VDEDYRVIHLCLVEPESSAQHNLPVETLEMTLDGGSYHY
jgi:hypothetical protein